MLAPIRQRIEREVISHTGLILGGVDYAHPPGDPGLFGPHAVCWKVHGDFSSMLVGGMSALLLQMLHPAALAGVWDYSNFREDLLGRLRRTGQFIAATTFGSTMDADKIIAHVRHIHAHIAGTTADGTPYAASDSHLLTWVHVAEMRSFMAAHKRYLNPAVSLADQNRYYAETALVAQRLGAEDIPTSVQAIDDYLVRMRPSLRVDARTLDVFNVLRNPPATNMLTKLFSQCALNAAIDLLPDWARAMYPSVARPVSVASRAVIHLNAPVLRWAVRDSARYRALKRCPV